MESPRLRALGHVCQQVQLSVARVVSGEASGRAQIRAHRRAQRGRRVDAACARLGGVGSGRWRPAGPLLAAHHVRAAQAGRPARALQRRGRDASVGQLSRRQGGQASMQRLRARGLHSAARPGKQARPRAPGQRHRQRAPRLQQAAGARHTAAGHDRRGVQGAHARGAAASLRSRGLRGAQGRRRRLLAHDLRLLGGESRDRTERAARLGPGQRGLLHGRVSRLRVQGLHGPQLLRHALRGGRDGQDDQGARAHRRSSARRLSQEEPRRAHRARRGRRGAHLLPQGTHLTDHHLLSHAALHSEKARPGCQDGRTHRHLGARSGTRLLFRLALNTHTHTHNNLFFLCVALRSQSSNYRH